MFVLLFVGCLHPAAPPPAVAPAPVAAPVSFELLDARISQLLPVAGDADQRDRLQALRAMIEGMKGRDPAAQAVVYTYLERTLTIEERVRPVQIEAMDAPLAVPIEEAPLTAPEVPAGDPVAEARAAFAAGEHARAVALLDTIPVADPRAADAVKLRKEVVDGWARAEREAAGAAFLKARELPAGPERAAAYAAVRDQLVAINQRHPDNAYAEAIRENIARVEAELAAP